MSDAKVAAAVVDRYEVDREIGRGGMATVYLARDIKHNRRVALKVLNPELGAVLGIERFLSEIQVTANLQHPNLLPLYDSGESNGLLYYVMPYIEGEGLRDRLNREKQLPVDDAVRIATAIASALDYAHAHGVIHRDLKPENILLQGGQPLVADFGIALAVSNAGGARITQTGLSLGTPQYMSPEQATGERVVDARSDIYSLGCVLYEMLGGEPPHMGGTAQAVIARILTEKPRHVRELRETVPEHVDWTIDRALAKVPADRFQSAGEMHDALVGRTVVKQPRARPSAAQRLARVAPWLVAGAALAWAGINAQRPTSATPDLRFQFVLPNASLIDGFALSPDGQSLAYVGGETKQLHVRALGDLEPRPLAGTSGADHPVWSPNGNAIAFTANGQLQRTTSVGGAVQVVSPYGFGYDWIDDESIVVGSALAGTGLRVSSRPGAALVTLTRPAIDSGVMFHVHPLVLPSNRVGFVTWGAGGLEDDYLAVGDLKTGEYVESRLVAVSTVGFVDGWLLYQDVDRKLMATRVDLASMRLGPTPLVVQENLISAAIAPTGTLLLTGVRSTAIHRVQLSSTAAPEPIVQSDGIITGPQLSPDRTRIVYVVTRGDSAQLFVHDVRSRTAVRLWTGGGVKDPVWTPDGRTIVFAEGAPRLGLWRLSVDGGTPELIASNGYPRHASVTPDGRTVVYTVNVQVSSTERRYDLWTASLVGAGTPQALVAERESKSLPEVSHNGRWLAYDSNESARDEVYVRPLKGSSAKWRVSLDGGMEPRWSRDGNRLYYRYAGDVIAATIRELPNGVEVVSRQKVARFASSSLSPWDAMYDDGGANDLLVASANEQSWQLVFVQNWQDELRRRVAARR